MTASEIRRIWDDIEKWYEKNAPDLYKDLPKGASAAQITKLEKAIGVPLPDDYRASLKIHNGGVYVGEYSLMNATDALRKWSGLSKLLHEGKFEDRKVEDTQGNTIQDTWWHRHWIPFAEESGGNLLALDMAPGKKGKKGQVIYMEMASGPFASEWDSFGDWLAQYSADLKAGKYELDSDGLLSEA